MQKKISLRLLPEEAADHTAIIRLIAGCCAVPPPAVTGYYPLQQSIDARGRQVWVNLTVQAYINEPFHNRPLETFVFRDVRKSPRRVIIIGAGPAGLFAALQLIEYGIQPVIIERGKNVRDRRRDLALLNKEGIIHEDSNYCFGEGGAGTYSDGKLYTRSSKRGDISRILQLFVHFGADEKILYQSHPHIGTNKLPQIITAMREQILDAGGVIHFEKRVTDFIISGDHIKGVKTHSGETFSADEYILASGHSARDIFVLLQSKNILIEPKAFALGVRVEHPQSLIDAIQYHCSPDKGRPEALPAASYSLVEQINDKGVFSFCMCPGGIIATASTAPDELVVNGWSPSRRNNPFANSGMVVQVEQKDAIQWLGKMAKKNKQEFNIENSPLVLMNFQQAVERKAYTSGGGKFVAPAQRLVDFSEGKFSASLPSSSYIPGLQSADLKEVLPDYIHRTLQSGFRAFGKKMKGYFTNEAVVVATESRTSSPVRIPRHEQYLHHPQVTNLYPTGEGAGYAGGIVSAAMDGQKVAVAICRKPESIA